MTTLRDMPMITIEQKNRFREAALKVEKERDEAKRMLATACEYLSRVSALVGGDEEEDPQTVVEMVEGVVIERDQLSDLLKAAGIDAKEIKAENARLRKERDELAAREAAAKSLISRLIEAPAYRGGPRPAAVQEFIDWASGGIDHLARRDARMKSEALEEAADMARNESWQMDHASFGILKQDLMGKAAEYRKQAEGEG